MTAYTLKDCDLLRDGKYVCSIAAPEIAQHYRLDGESWLAMYQRTEPLRDAAALDQKKEAEFFLKAVNNHPALVAALTRIANMQDRDGNEIEMHREELRGIARTALDQVEKSKS